jgi:sorbitol/mannitol transport system permease protein
MTAILEPLADPEPAAPQATPGRLAPWKTGWGRRLPLLPALLYVIILTQVPFLYTIWYSFRHWILIEPGDKHWAGFSNYTQIFDNSLFRSALYTSVKLTVFTVVISVVLGLAFAVLLDRKFLGRSVARTLLITPFLVVPAASGQIWKNLMLDPSYGLMNWLLSPFGVHHEAFATVHPLASVIGVQVWEWTPFMTLIIIAGLQGQPADTLEAAQVDGAGPWATFRELTLPHLRPYIELGVLLGAIYVVNEFDIVDTLTAGGPGTATQNIPYYLYQMLTNGGNVGQASAIGVVTVILTIIVASFALRLISSVFRMEPGK